MEFFSSNMFAVLINFAKRSRQKLESGPRRRGRLQDVEKGDFGGRDGRGPLHKRSHGCAGGGKVHREQNVLNHRHSSARILGLMTRSRLFGLPRRRAPRGMERSSSRPLANLVGSGSATL